MGQFKNHTIFGVVAVVAILGSAIGAMSLMDGTASAGPGTPKHFVTAEPVADPPATAKIVDWENTAVKNNEAIRQAINKAVEEDRFVKIRLDEPKYEDVKSTLDASPVYESGGQLTGLLVNKDGIVVRVKYITAIPA